jgi:hypothetical protein
LDGPICCPALFLELLTLREGCREDLAQKRANRQRRVVGCNRLRQTRVECQWMTVSTVLLKQDRYEISPTVVRLVTVGAVQLKLFRSLDQSLRSLVGLYVFKALQAWLEVFLVIEFHLGGVYEPRLVIHPDSTCLVVFPHQHREFWMGGTEPLDRALKGGRAMLRLEICVALGTVPIAHESQDDMPLVLYMATRTSRGHGLAIVMNGAVVAGQASSVRYPKPKARLGLRGLDRHRDGGNVALAALHAEHGMPGGDRPTGIDSMIAARRQHNEPYGGDGRRGDCQDEFQTSKRVQALEVLEIDPFGDSLGRPWTGHGASPGSVAEGDDGVYRGK